MTSVESTTPANVSSVTPTQSILEKTKTEIVNNLEKPSWQFIALLVGIAVVLLGICFCCIRRCFRKRRSKDSKKGIKGVDLKPVHLLGPAYKEKVQPDMEELTENAEEPDDGDSKKEEQKLGKLQYKVSTVLDIHRELIAEYYDVRGCRYVVTLTAREYWPRRPMIALLTNYSVYECLRIYLHVFVSASGCACKHVTLLTILNS
ncbi:Synaptotagmin 1 [Eumeta japonica]|uniref:Synaptotagmin 1 n=1 Tax=Eumeta variegata TaxID=151549 RepID=A0A4C1XQV3_EUMVA|nr:Synaptotagmin 1 [Eumeta japonica]